MSRDDGRRPDPYDACIIYNLRQADEGGEPAKFVNLQIRVGRALSKREVVVLVHGFNNHRGEAEFAYQGFRERQRELLESIELNGVNLKLRDCFWPGDAAWRGALDKLDFLVFPSAVGTAKEVGERLGIYLLGSPTISKVHFIGHSLGCRVVLETINYMIANSTRRMVGRVCFMAAAVPMFTLLKGGRLRRTLFEADSVLNLFSKSDRVLQFAFPAGQSIAPAREGVLPRALGRYAFASANTASRLVEGANHGDYWGHNDDDSSRKAAVLANNHVADFFRWRKTTGRPTGRQVAYRRDAAASTRRPAKAEREPARAREAGSSGRRGNAAGR